MLSFAIITLDSLKVEVLFVHMKKSQLGIYPRRQDGAVEGVTLNSDGPWFKSSC